MQNLLNTQQAAEMLSVSVEAVRSMIARGDIKSFQTRANSPHLIPLGEILKNQEIRPRSVKMTFWEYTQINALNASKIKLLNLSLNHFLVADKEDNSRPSVARDKGLSIHSYL
ncbi:MAG: helix-turn-helix domain-containing protein, partial [bacterium]